MTMHKEILESESRRVGAFVCDDGEIEFRVWAPKAKGVDLVWLGTGDERKLIAMSPEPRGYFSVKTKEAFTDGLYKFRLSKDNEHPDPASRYQPEGPHGPSQVVADQFPWTDQSWKGNALDELVIYELHVGTFTPEGTFEAAEKKIAHLKSIGVNAIEIMPVAQFAGERNWGYDGVGLFATQNSYSKSEISPVALKKFVNACHANGISVILDVVYNHIGPEGNYLPQFGPYFQTKYHTPWGDALNYDGDWSDEVRNFFLQNAKQWLEEFHFDGLRLDAVHAIFDTSATPFLEELGRMKNELQEKLNRSLYLIAESDANDSRILQSPDEGGHGMDAQWADDLHHVVHSLVTGETFGYYADYGKLEHLAAIYRDGVLFHGEYSEFRHRSHGRDYRNVSRSRLVVCSQNHDQIGNRMKGERITAIAGHEKQKLAAACVFLSPCMPLMYMGEEFGETAPFQYFVSHTDPNLLAAVRKGRSEEFASFKWSGEAPDPGAESTFKNSRLNWSLVDSGQGKEFLAFYKKLIELSKWVRKSRVFESGQVESRIENNVVQIVGSTDTDDFEVAFSFAKKAVEIRPILPIAEGVEIVLDSRKNGSLDSESLKDKMSLEPFSVKAWWSRKPKEENKGLSEVL